MFDSDRGLDRLNSKTVIGTRSSVIEFEIDGLSRGLARGLGLVRGSLLGLKLSSIHFVSACFEAPLGSARDST